MQCVTEAQVLGLLRDALTADERVAVEHHLDACAECLELVTLASKTSLAARDVASGAGAPPVRHDVGALPPGTIVGRYEIAETIGRGGMGTVYAARDTQLDRRVAIKLVNPSLAASPQSQVALLREAQAMARITQPNVLTVYDMGTFEDAVFLAAELVDGETVEAWTARPRPWRQIVGVFVQAAAGLAAAHAAGLVHRDFKPTNVLVGNDGRVRVFDFGVVRFTDTEAPGRELAGTPIYMSPEQLRGDVADARSDQYAFCVALHEALFGRRPPPLIAGAPSEPRAAAADRVPRWLRDIVSRGLEPDPERRFPSMSAVIAALERGLARRGRGVAAAIAGVAVTAAAATAVVGYTRGVHDSQERCPLVGVGSAWSGARKAQVSAAFAATELPYAAAAWPRVERVLDGFAATWAGRRRDACLAFDGNDPADRALYDRRAACLDAQRQVFEAIVDRFSAAERGAAVHADRLLAALPDLEVCAHPDAASLPASPAARAQLAAHFREVAQITSLAEGGQYDEAARRIPALTAAAKALGFRRAEADAVYLAGHVAGLRGQLDEGRRQVEQALWVAEATRYDELVVTAASELLWIVGKQRRPADGRAFVELVRAAAERAGSPLARARAARAIGGLELVAGNSDAAERELTRALALAHSVPSPDQILVANLMMDLANVDSQRGRFAAAEQRQRAADALYVKELGELHPKHAQVLSNLGNALADQQRYGEAAAAYDRSVEVLERALGPDHIDVAQVLSNAATLQIAVGSLDRAGAMLRRSIRIFERVDPEHAILASALNNLGEVLHLQGDMAGAERSKLRSLELRRKKLGEQHPKTTESLLSLADLALERGDRAAAETRCTEARRSIEGSGSGNAALRASAETCRGRLELLAGRRARAVEIFERALELHAGSEDAGRRAATQFALADALPADAAARAVELARAARATYALEPTLRKQELAAIDAWLRTRGAASK